MSELEYERTGAIARLELNRPRRGNGLTRALLEQPRAAVEWADLDPQVKVLLLSGRGKGFCGGYDLVDSAEGRGLEHQDPAWDPMVDHAMMSCNVRAFMSLFDAGKPVVCRLGPQRAKRLLFTGDCLTGTKSQTMKLMVNSSLRAHTPEGHAFRERAARAGFRVAVRERDQPFGDARAWAPR